MLHYCELIGDAIVRIHEKNQSAHSLLTKKNKVILLIYLDNAATTPMSAVAIQK